MPIWLTEYGYETKPAEPHGVTYGQQASYLRQAIVFARKDPDVQMFTWFTFRDSPGNPWQSGIEQPSGARKPGFASFASIARSTDGVTSSARPGAKPSLTVYVPRLSYDQPPGSLLQVSYTVTAPGSALRSGTTTSILSASESVTFRPSFTVLTGKTYSITAVVTTPDGEMQTRRATIIAS